MNWTVEYFLTHFIGYIRNVLMLPHFHSLRACTELHLPHNPTATLRPCDEEVRNCYLLSWQSSLFSSCSLCKPSCFYFQRRWRRCGVTSDISTEGVWVEGSARMRTSKKRKCIGFFWFQNVALLIEKVFYLFFHLPFLYISLFSLLTPKERVCPLSASVPSRLTDCLPACIFVCPVACLPIHLFMR